MCVFMCKVCGSVTRLFLAKSVFKALEADPLSQPFDYIRAGVDIAWNPLSDESNYFNKHLFESPTCVHKQTKLVLWEAAVAGGPIPKTKWYVRGQDLHVDAGLPSSSFNPKGHLASDYVHVFEFRKESGATGQVPIRFVAPAGTTAIPSLENVLFAHGNGQVIIDRTRDCMRSYGIEGGDRCYVKTADGVATVENDAIYVVAQAVVCWNPTLGLSSGPLGHYRDPKCWIRLVSWLPTTKEWFKGTYGRLPTEKCLRPDMYWPLGWCEPAATMDPRSAVVLTGVSKSDQLVKTTTPTWTPKEVDEVRDFRARHPACTADYSLWQVTVGMIQQKFVRFKSEQDRDEYRKVLKERKKIIDDLVDDNKTQVRQLDDRSWRLWVWDEHNRQAQQGYRPARPEDVEAWSANIENLVVQLGTIFIVFCNRQVVDGAGGHQTVIEAWIWRPGDGSWYLTEYRGQHANARL